MAEQELNSTPGVDPPGTERRKEMRLYQLFHTEAEQKAWEAEHSIEPRFRVCMRMTAKELESDLRLDKGYLAEYQTATIYTYD